MLRYRSSLWRLDHSSATERNTAKKTNSFSNTSNAWTFVFAYSHWRRIVDSRNPPHVHVELYFRRSHGMCTLLYKNVWFHLCIFGRLVFWCSINASTHIPTPKKMDCSWLQNSRSQSKNFGLPINPFIGHSDLGCKNYYWKYVVSTQLCFRALRFPFGHIFWNIFSKTCFNVRRCVTLCVSACFCKIHWKPYEREIAAPKCETSSENHQQQKWMHAIFGWVLKEKRCSLTVCFNTLRNQQVFLHSFNFSWPEYGFSKMELMEIWLHQVGIDAESRLPELMVFGGLLQTWPTRQTQFRTAQKYIWFH